VKITVTPLFFPADAAGERGAIRKFKANLADAGPSLEP